MSKKVLKAEFGSKDRPLKIGNVEIPCYVLEDGTRVLTQYGFYEAIGRSGKPARGRGSSLENIAPFLALQNLKPFIDEELIDSTKPIKFLIEKGSTAWGYRAEILPKVCEVYLKARDAKSLLKSQEKFAVACDIIMRGLAYVGIIALVDEATGYQEFRDRDELHRILSAYISKELMPWTRRFPEEFYREIFRLHGWEYNPMTVKRPSYVGKLTNNLVYEKLPTGVLDELKRRNPKDEKGRRKVQHHRLLTLDIGSPHLEKQLVAVTTLLKVSPNWPAFKRHFSRAFPNGPEQVEMPFVEDGDEK